MTVSFEEDADPLNNIEYRWECAVYEIDDFGEAYRKATVYNGKTSVS